MLSPYEVQSGSLSSKMLGFISKFLLLTQDVHAYIKQSMLRFMVSFFDKRCWPGVTIGFFY